MVARGSLAAENLSSYRRGCLGLAREKRRVRSNFQAKENRKNDVLAHQNITPGLGAELAPEIQLTNLSDGQINSLQQLASERGIVVSGSGDVAARAGGFRSSTR